MKEISHVKQHRGCKELNLDLKMSKPHGISTTLPMNFKTVASLFCLQEILPEKAKKDEKVPPVGNRWLGTAMGNRSNGWWMLKHSVRKRRWINIAWRRIGYVYHLAFVSMTTSRMADHTKDVCTELSVLVRVFLCWWCPVFLVAVTARQQSELMSFFKVYMVDAFRTLTNNRSSSQI